MAVSWSGIYPERQTADVIKAEIEAARVLGAKGFVIFHLDHLYDEHWRALKEATRWIMGNTSAALVSRLLAWACICRASAGAIGVGVRCRRWWFRLAAPRQGRGGDASRDGRTRRQVHCRRADPRPDGTRLELREHAPAGDGSGQAVSPVGLAASRCPWARLTGALSIAGARPPPPIAARPGAYRSLRRESSRHVAACGRRIPLA